MDVPGAPDEALDDAVLVPEGLIKLVSGDGFSFVVEQQYAMISSVIRTMMNSSFKESRTRTVRLPHVKGRVLEKICQYFYYVPRFRSRQELATSSKSGQDATIALGLDSFAETFDIPPDISLEIYLCARYLEL